MFCLSADIANRFLCLFRSTPARLGILAAACLLLPGSCDIDDKMEICSYNVQLKYSYWKDATSSVNEVASYINGITEYIFDENDVLYAVNALPGTSCSGAFFSEQTLPAGKYSVVSWANINGISRVNSPKVFVTRKEELMLYLDVQAQNRVRQSPSSAGTISYNSEKLYYGHRTFRINDGRISRVNVDMLHAHCILRLSVRWKTNTPENTHDFYILYKEIPAVYSFIPEYIHRLGEWKLHDPAAEEYSALSSEKIHYTPAHSLQDRLTNHRRDVSLNVDKRIETEFITYRYYNHSRLLLSLYAGDKQLMKEIDLANFFRSADIDLDRNFRQEFELEIEIDGDKVNVGFLDVSGWEEGGVIGGSW